MKWNKRGRIYVPDGRHAWARRYAFPPTPYFLDDEVIRVFVAFCDEHTVGRIGYVDVAADDPARVLHVSDRPVLDIGTPGAFDENGILPTSILEFDDKLYLYYVGYQLGMKVRYYQFQGLAVSADRGRSFTRVQRVPVIDRSDQELLNRTSAFVRRRQDRFQMWYVGGSDWTMVNGKALPMYNIRYLESADGINWPRAGRVCIDYEDPDEHAFGKPFVIEDGGRHKMFYSVRTRSKGYRIGYAESEDGHTWRRRDAEVGIDVSPTGWDSEMIAYASVVKHEGQVYMFYNGNNLGESGFGYAVLEQW
jgi:sucrose-6-phosphate hydrolase SacC (GH32 family)